MVSRIPIFLVTSGTQPYKTVRELMQDVKSKPGTYSYASNGIGAMAHVGTEMLLNRAGAKMVHVPYNGFTPALSDLVTGRVSMVMADLAPVKGQLEANKLRVLAVASAERSRFMPDVPTLAEAGYPSSEFEVWLGLYAPAGTPKAVIDRVHAEVAKYMATPAAREAYAKLGHDVGNAGPEAVRQRIVEEQKAFAPAEQAAGLGQGK